jgi:hypothetical protein
MTMEDPGTFKKPWLIRRISDLDQTNEVMEYICNENEKDLKHLPEK